VQSFVQGRSLGLNPTVTTYSIDTTTRACTATATAPSALGAGSGICVKAQTTFAFTRIIPLPTLTLQSTAQMIITR